MGCLYSKPETLKLHQTLNKGGGFIGKAGIRKIPAGQPKYF